MKTSEETIQDMARDDFHCYEVDQPQPFDDAVDMRLDAGEDDADRVSSALAELGAEKAATIYSDTWREEWESNRERLEGEDVGGES